MRLRLAQRAAARWAVPLFPPHSGSSSPAMRALTAAELLRVWEEGTLLSPLHRALALLQAAAPEMSFEQLARLPIGQRDRRLLQLRAAVFGPEVAAVASCPQCGEKLDVTFHCDQLNVESPPPGDGPFRLECDGHSLTFRVPDTFDLMAAGALPDPAAAETQLLHRCLLSAHRGDDALSPDTLPEPVLAALALRLAESDPQADLQLAMGCPACAHRWAETFDIVSFFWREIEAWAGRLFGEVHTLASAYGWTEHEILSLSPTRRRLYLEQVNA